MLHGDSYREVFANRSFRALWLSQSLARLGRAIAQIALTLFVYERTGSARELSFALALQLLPWVVVGPLAGMLADRLERKSVLVSAYLAQAALVALLPFTRSLGQMYALVFLSTLLAPITEITHAAALPAVTGPQLFVRGSSLDIVSLNGVNVLGPAIGGWVVGLLGARPAFFIVVACLVGATLLTLQALVPSPAQQHAPFVPRLILSDVCAGLGYLLRHPLLRYVLVLHCISSISWSSPNMASVIYLSDHLGMGAEEYGLLQAVGSLSIALGVYVLGHYARTLPRRPLLFGGVVLAGLSYLAVLVQPGYALLLVLWFISGIGWSANWLIDSAIFAEATPDALRGRVYSMANTTIYLAEVLNTLGAGWLIGRLGPVGALGTIGGVITLGSMILGIATMPPRRPQH